MAFFKRNPPDEEDSLRRQQEEDAGKRRLLRVLDRDGGRLFLTGLLTLLGYLPAIAAAAYCFATLRFQLLLVACTLTGPLCMMVQCAMYDTTLRSLRHESNFWWSTYRRAWKQNGRACILPGLLYGFAYGALSGALGYTLLSGGRPPLPRLLLLLLCTLLLTALHTLTVAQLALVENPFDVTIRNSLLLTVSFFPRVLLSALLECAYWAALLLFLPLSVILIVLLGFWAASLIALVPVYDAPINQVFRIESRLRELREDAEESGRENGTNT